MQDYGEYEDEEQSEEVDGESSQEDDDSSNDEGAEEVLNKKFRSILVDDRRITPQFPRLTKKQYKLYADVLSVSQSVLLIDLYIWLFFFSFPLPAYVSLFCKEACYNLDIFTFLCRTLRWSYFMWRAGVSEGQHRLNVKISVIYASRNWWF